VQIEIHKVITLSPVFHECGTWSLILREEHRLRVFGNRVLKGKKGQEARGNRIISSLIIYAPHQIILE
jgi:hypothetical protein